MSTHCPGSMIALECNFLRLVRRSLLVNVRAGHTPPARETRRCPDGRPCPRGLGRRGAIANVLARPADSSSTFATTWGDPNKPIAQTNGILDSASSSVCSAHSGRTAFVRQRHAYAGAISVRHLAVLVFVASMAIVGGGAGARAKPSAVPGGQLLFRSHCLACHALSPAPCAGCAGVGPSEPARQFGGGPNLYHFKISRAETIDSVEDGTPAHLYAVKDLTWPDLESIADLVASATEHDGPTWASGG